MIPGELPYSEGDLFAVPLRDDDGFGIGLVARMDGAGEILGFFFGPRRSEVPRLDEVAGVQPEDAIHVKFFGDLGLLELEWPVIGQLPSWDRSEWSAPDFGYVYEMAGTASRYHFEDADDYVRQSAEAEVTRQEASSLPRLGVSGYGAIEMMLTHLLT